jgi:hypothetical protein
VLGNLTPPGRKQPLKVAPPSGMMRARRPGTPKDRLDDFI